MIKKYYDSAIRQVIDGIKKNESNHLMVRYTNDFQIKELESVTCEEQDDVFFSCYEFEYNAIPEGYEPYLSIIRTMFQKVGTGSFSAFMKECDVYELHRPIFESYFETGYCKREELILLDEVEYEKERMASAIVQMLKNLSQKCPIAILLNRFQYAAKSTMLLTYRLLCEEDAHIGLILGVNDSQSIPEFVLPVWDSILEKMDDRNQIYHIGNSEKKREMFTSVEVLNAPEDVEEYYRKVMNQVEFLDYEQALHFLQRVERRIKFDNMEITEENYYLVLKLLAAVAILTRDLAKALEVCEEMEDMLQGRTERAFQRSYILATTYMYLGKLQEAMDALNAARIHAEHLNNPFWLFRIELLNAQIQMSGWCNIFFCAQDIKISDTLIEQLNQYNYRNHLAHIYIYAYDNKPEIVAQAYRSEEFLLYFSKGVAIAKEIGNEQLIATAYRKNIMIASTNGMYEVSLLYSIRTYEALKTIYCIEGGRNFSGIAYNLCALGQHEKADQYYSKAIEIFYNLKVPEDIAEVQYNMALNFIMLGEYRKAENYLAQCMRAIEKLQLNSLRVCNLSKLYGLMALVSILQGNRFNCERYLYNCRHFLNYILEKEKVENNLATVHDYAKSDDDMFLYTFSQALLYWQEEDYEAAIECYEQADDYLKRAEGNQYFCYELFRKARMECFKKLGKDILFEREASILEHYKKAHLLMGEKYAEEMVMQLPKIEGYISEISAEQIEELLRLESVERSNKSKKRQLEFISTWQKQIDVTGVSAKEMIDGAMKTFLNHFNIDKAVYIRYVEHEPQILYNNTECELTETVLACIEQAMKNNQNGFAISKISSNYSEHQDVTSVFGDDNVCSMVAIPFFNKAKIESILIAYVLMKDNWHSSVNRYMLDEEDLNFYQMLFREVRYSLNRIDAYEKIFEMNNKLYLSAVTDQLTGIFNREGFYRKLSSTIEEIKCGKRTSKLGLMFIDLDNFKHYNDTFGHDIGDLILIKMANIFKELCEGKGFVCRYGGDEFLIVYYTDDRAFLEDNAKEIYRKIESANGFQQEISEKLEQEVVIDKKQHISCSIGITVASDIHSEEDMNNMIKHADELLYSIKTSVKGTYKI